MTSDQPALPGMPEPPAPLRRAAPSGKATATRIRKRTLCNRCCLLIHQLGVEMAPYPRTARWRVTTDGLSVPMCESHKNEVM